MSTRGILLKSFKFSWFSIFCGILKTKFCTDLCEEPTWITPFWRGKKTREPLVKSIQKDQEEKIIKIHTLCRGANIYAWRTRVISVAGGLFWTRVRFCRRQPQKRRRVIDNNHPPPLEIKKVLATTYFPALKREVSLALEGLTSEFGMVSGVTPPPWSPGLKFIS